MDKVTPKVIRTVFGVVKLTDNRASRRFMKTLAHPATKIEILRRLEQVCPDSQRQWGKMTPHQMICHLGDSFRMVMGAKAVRPRGTALQQVIMKWGALYVPRPQPKGLRTLPEVDQDIGGTKPVDFKLDLNALVLLLHDFTERPRCAKRPLHPIFGRLTEREWMRWGYLHMDHHLRQFGV